MVTDRQKVRTDGRNGRTHGRRQNYIPPTSPVDKNAISCIFSDDAANVLRFQLVPKRSFNITLVYEKNLVYTTVIKPLHDLMSSDL